MGSKLVAKYKRIYSAEDANESGLYDMGYGQDNPIYVHVDPKKKKSKLANIPVKYDIEDKIQKAYAIEKQNRENKYGAMLGMGGLDKKGDNGKSLGDTIGEVVERLFL